MFRGATLGTDKGGLDLSGTQLSIIMDPLHRSYLKSLCFPIKVNTSSGCEPGDRQRWARFEWSSTVTWDPWGVPL